MDSSSVQNTIDANLPFQFSTSDAYLPIIEKDRISIFTGNCQDNTTLSQLWRFTPNTNEKNGTWRQTQLSQSGASISANWLAAGFSFSPTASINDSSVYIFGGMCPVDTSTSSSWTSQASYSNLMLTATPSDVQSYVFTSSKSPPIAEAGLTITPMTPTYSNASSGKISQQQNFVLLGGHTQTAFINMSQVAVYSLPEAAWAFVGVNQPKGSDGELMRRDSNVVEPRSGHTAILSTDGTKVIMLGGWVGDVTNPASPQLAVLNIGQGYGGTGSWYWSIPSQTASPFSSGQGIYGHGAIMLPGNVMMVSGGTAFGQSTKKRATSQNRMFYNITSSTWTSSYRNIGSSADHTTSAEGLTSSQKAGIGAGLSLGIAALIGVAAFWFLYARRMKRQRIEREKRLRELALGSAKFQSHTSVVGGQADRPEMRSASWGSNQEKQIEGHGDSYPWAPAGPLEDWNALKNHAAIRDAEQLRLDVPSPTTGLRRSLHSRGPAGFGNHFGIPATAGLGSVFRIDEEEEGSVKSLRMKKSHEQGPFQDPPKLEPRNEAAEERKKEVQGWIEDWQSAAEVLTLSRNPSQARTYSNLSQAHSMSNSSSDRTGGISPERSDRTGSNLSEKSHFSVSSIQKSVQGTVSRSMSQRSASAGYSLFAGAASAMSKYVGGNMQQGLDRSASKRSISLNSGQTKQPRPFSAESQAPLLDRSPSKTEPNGYWTPPESPIKDYKNYARTSSLTSQSRGRTRARGVLGSFKRVLTGTSQVNVQAQVEHFEEVEKEVEIVDQPEMTESRTINPVEPFWQSKKGARDWHDEISTTAASSSDVRRRSGGGRQRQDSHVEEYDGEDWDVETAIQKRVVQVMFTVPKEKLRVVNADALSLISRSDIGGDDLPDIDVKRMSSVKESDDVDDEDINEKGKGRAPGWPLVD